MGIDHEQEHEHDYEKRDHSVVEQGHEGVPDREHDEQKRKGHVNEKPAMEPMVEADLNIEHPSLVAPRLDFFDAAAITLGNPKLRVAKGFIGKTEIVSSHPIASARPEM